ncbi:hypothetical protein [Streptomyces erythrochromogenes]|uniref:hypothetical protein n=1 Tax=Streptomyces erythrochromogenes TaxID=285574 RepID=UPI00386AA6B4|nr:hypothetical protein OG364_16005 [Streptomyces erythrochromogenes]
MHSRPIARRTGLLVAAGTTALMLVVAVPASAPAAVGDIQVALGEPGKEGPLLATPHKLIRSPKDGHCYTVKEVFPDAPEGGYFRSVANQTNTSIFIYQADACAGSPYDRTPMEPGRISIGLPVLSIKVVPAPTLNPEDFRTTPPPAG